MMGRFFHRTDDAMLRVDLLPLSDYEADGGAYDDSGNAGERVDPGQFVAALVICERPEGSEDFAPTDDILWCANAIGVPNGALWSDSATGWTLISEFPAHAPLEARMGLS